MTYQNLERVCDDVYGTLNKSRDNGNDLGNIAHVFNQFLKGYMRGLELSGRPFADTDSFAVMELMALARQSARLGTVPESYSDPLDAATYAVLRACHANPPALAPDVAQDQPERSEADLYRELLDLVGGDYMRLEAIEFPDHWTMAEAKRYRAYKRKLEAEEREKMRAAVQSIGEGPIVRAYNQMDEYERKTRPEEGRGVSPFERAVSRDIDKGEPLPSWQDISPFNYSTGT